MAVYAKNMVTKKYYFNCKLKIKHSSPTHLLIKPSVCESHPIRKESMLSVEEKQFFLLLCAVDVERGIKKLGIILKCDSCKANLVESKNT